MRHSNVAAAEVSDSMSHARLIDFNGQAVLKLRRVVDMQGSLKDGEREGEPTITFKLGRVQFGDMFDHA